MPDNNKHLFIAYGCAGRLDSRGCLEPDRVGSTLPVVFNSIPHSGTRDYPGKFTLGQVAEAQETKPSHENILKAPAHITSINVLLAKASPLAESKDNGVRKYWPTPSGGAARLYGGRSTD